MSEYLKNLQESSNLLHSFVRNTRSIEKKEVLEEKEPLLEDSKGEETGITEEKK